MIDFGKKVSIKFGRGGENVAEIIIAGDTDADLLMAIKKAASYDFVELYVSVLDGLFGDGEDWEDCEDE